MASAFRARACEIARCNAYRLWLFVLRMSFDYRDKRWTRLRERVLREDGYRCQYARRFGKRVQANTVHHIWPAEDFPQYAYERWNLISLSNEAHNRMHDRTTGRLTEIGEQLRRRTIPPLRSETEVPIK